jgi:hypothetical protein
VVVYIPAITPVHHQPCLTEQGQLLGYVRLAQPEKGFQVADTGFPLTQLIQDGNPRWVGEQFQ